MRTAATMSRMPNWHLMPAARSLPLRVQTIANLGRLSIRCSRRAVPTYLYAALLSGQYQIPQIYCEVDAVYTNTAPVDAMRGAGRPEATFVVERLVERRRPRDSAAIRPPSAARISSTRSRIRRPFSLPTTPATMAPASRRRWSSPTTRALPSASAKRRATASCAASASRPISKPAGWRPRKQSARSAPAWAYGNPPRCGSIRPDRSKSSPAPTATDRATRPRLRKLSPIGSAFRSRTFRWCTATPTRCSSAWAPTARAPARSAFRRSSKRSTRSRPRPKKSRPICSRRPRAISSSRTENSASPAPTSPSAWGDVALNAYVAHKFSGQELEPGLKEGAFYDPTNFTFPAGCHICEVEVDPETGNTEIVAWTAVDDFGVIINPMIVEGQVHGGIAHGIGQALCEGAIYNKDGQLVTGSLMDYCDAARRSPADADSRRRRSPNARPIRSASRAAAKPAPLLRPPPSSTPSPTPSGPKPSPCRRRRRRCGRRCRSRASRCRTRHDEQEITENPDV